MATHPCWSAGNNSLTFTGVFTLPGTSLSNLFPLPGTRLSNLFQVCLFNSIFSKISLHFLLALDVANAALVWGHGEKIDYPAHHRK